MEAYDVRLCHPCTMLISGPSGSGKTYFTKSLLECSESIFKPSKPNFNILIYHTWQNVYQEMQDNNLIHMSINGLSDFDYLKEVFEQHKEHGGSLIIIDDQMENINQNIVTIFTIISHHMNVTCLLLTQSLFLSNKMYRTISLNSNYICLFKNARDRTSVTQLAKQTHPFRTRFITYAYVDATTLPHSYLLFDLHQETPEHLRIRANIFSDPITVYVSK